MTTFFEPDATKYPDNFQAIKCSGLEILTGVDFVISNLAPNPLTGEVISPVQSLQSHINAHSLFVQLKIGYDIISFDQLHSSIARIQDCKIPKGQAILLPVGEYWEKDGLLRVKGKKAFGNPPTPFSTLGTIYDMWSMRGGIVEPLPPKSIDDLQDWIDRKQKPIEKVEHEGNRDIYPPRPIFQPDDIWQVVKEINDWRRFLVSGLKGCGSDTANSIFKYANEHIPGQEFGFYHILCLMTDEDKKGNAIHKISGWGKVSRKRLRGILGLSDGQNLSELDYELVYFQGWRSCLDQFIYMVSKEKSLNPQKLQKIFDDLKTEKYIPF